MAVVFDGPRSYSNSGLLYSHFTNDGKLKIWDTSNSTLKQEYTKNFHLSSPCTCLVWLQISKRGEAKKRKLKSASQGARENLDIIALGTANGNIILYNVATNSVESQLDGHSAKVNFLTSSDKALFSCSDDTFLIEWDLLHHKPRSKWKSGGEKISCLLVLSNGKNLLTASSTIKLWDLETKQVLKLFKGHATEVTFLLEVPDLDGYFLSAAKGDRVINAWSLKTKEENESLASFLLQSGVSSMHLTSSDDHVITLCAVTDSGVLHVFRHKLNGSISKPLKPFLNITISASGSSAKNSNQPIPIQSVKSLSNGNILIGYGNSAFLYFETLSVDNQEEHTILIREDRRKGQIDDFNSKIKVPIVDQDVEYQTPSTTPHKRKGPKTLDVPLEQRLENLALVNPVTGETFKKDNMAQLLVQGLQSKDKAILQSVLFITKDSVINSTVKHLPIQALVPLIKEITSLLQGKTFTSRCAMKWMTSVLKIHSAILLSIPEITTIFEPVSDLIDTRMSLLPQLLRLRGRLNLVTEQLYRKSSDDVKDEEVTIPFVSYQDQDSSEDGEMDAASDESDDNWDEFSDMEDEQEDEEMEEK